MAYIFTGHQNEIERGGSTNAPFLKAQTREGKRKPKLNETADMIFYRKDEEKHLTGRLRNV